MSRKISNSSVSSNKKLPEIMDIAKDKNINSNSSIGASKPSFVSFNYHFIFND